MFRSSELGDELQALRNEMSHLLSMPADDMFDAAIRGTEAIADQIKAGLSELAEAFGEEEENVEKLVAERPIAALASAFALGLVIGLILRRH